MTDVPRCTNCGRPHRYIRYTTKAADYAPKLCGDCYISGMRKDKAERIVSPWMIDAQGIRSRTVEGGA